MCGRVPLSLSFEQKQRVMGTLKEIHGRGFIHGDIRNENILVDDDGKPSIIDFGFAKQSNDREAHEEEMIKLLRCLSEL